MENTLTKRDRFECIANFLTKEVLEKHWTGDEDICGITVTEAIETIKNEIDILDRRKVRDEERRQKNREIGDDLKKTVFNLLSTEEFKTQNDLLNEINDVEISGQKIVNRLTALVKEGLVEKEDIKIEGKDGKKYTKKGYRRVNVAE